MDSFLKILLGAFGGALLTYILQEWRSKRERDRRTRSLWEALRAEVTMAGRMARKFLGLAENEDSFFEPVKNDGLRHKSPDYRLPSVAYRTALPALIGEGLVRASEYSALISFYVNVDRLNRGLDNAARLREVDNQNDVAIRDQLECNLRYAMLLTPASELTKMRIKTEGRRLPNSVFGFWEKAKDASTLHDDAIRAIESTAAVDLNPTWESEITDIRGLEANMLDALSSDNAA